MQLLKKHVTRIAVALALGTGTLIGGSGTASAADVHPQYWNYKCDYGRACIYSISGQVWNADQCGVNPVNGVYNYAKAHGNSFRVWYQDWTWDVVTAWSERTLDGGNVVTEVQVYC
ncbi:MULTISPECIES: hypothetical protein [Streptomyces]|jgi:hypothetical protein|uniref:Peptidase inhibitor family I36 n=2 Tax=Streptomyces griseoaurantiacus TaxID=68213 RepID=A0A7W2HY06_9ACTN|nr:MULTISPECIES: hypothetical protein [Streptomyces]MBA5225806.1 hypothetical protein [Streptomyces griseoaurantiacus]MCF0087101.1 hypothetical protein [Streptomyces sp. MH192]MCF0099243.1 hypothetical protein [Streptomyces sp. MH191]GHE35232.1 hypothetical protein GCM10018782_07060 [Streptomyces griseoaurantiacus]